MRIAFESNLVLPPISTAISMLMDRARICIDDIQYDKVEEIVKIPMRRNVLHGFKKKVIGETQPVYGQSSVESLLIIQQVEEFKINVDDRLVKDCDSCFTVLFGLRFKDNNLSIGSVEEAQGDSLCQIYIKVRRINLEFYDVDIN